MPDYNTAVNTLNTAIANSRAKKEAGVADVKNTYGLTDRIERLNSIKKTALETDKMLSDLPSNIRSRSAGRLVTAAQANRWLAKETEPLARSLVNIQNAGALEEQGIGLIRSLINDVIAQEDNSFQPEYTLGLNTVNNAFQSQQNALSRALEGARLEMQRKQLELAQSNEEANRQDRIKSEKSKIASQILKSLKGKSIKDPDALFRLNELRKLGYNLAGIKVSGGLFGDNTFYGL